MPPIIPDNNKLEQDILVAVLSIVTQNKTEQNSSLNKAIIVKVKQEQNDLSISIIFAYPNKSQHAKVQDVVKNLVKPITEVYSLTIENKIKRHQIQGGLKGIPTIKNIIAVGSGKGGVGKSTVAVNIAKALVSEGAKVGVLDADIYGPSIPIMLGVNEKPSSPDGKTMTPIEKNGLKAMSIGFLIEQDTPMIWRGPIVTNTLKQLLNETNWGDLDYLIIDLPPGTGDTQLTLAQNIPVSGSLIVTTPQNIALADARKAIRMFEKVNIHILGVVENMSVFICPHCNKSSHIFQVNGGEKIAQQYSTNLLGSIPLNANLCKIMDEGLDIQTDEVELFSLYTSLALKLTSSLATQPIDFTAKMPFVEIKKPT